VASPTVVVDTGPIVALLDADEAHHEWARRQFDTLAAPLLTCEADNDRKSELSFAYIAALAARVGYTCQRGPQPDVDSIDATIRSGDAVRTQFDVQLKATSSPDEKKDGLHFRLSRKNYNDLAALRVTPLVLVVLVLPPSEADWLACTVEHLTIRGCGWWTSIASRVPTDAESKTVVIPATQRIDMSGLAPLMARQRRQTP